MSEYTPDNEQAASSPDELITDLDVKLTESDWDQVKGGETVVTQDLTVNKAKTADKAFKAMDGYIRG